jgi:hypothetical protein
MIEKIGKIRKTMLGYEDHGIFTLSLDMDYGGTEQGAGGYCLDQYDKSVERRVGTAYGHEFIIRTLKAVGARKWEDVAGKTILVLFEDDSWGAIPVGIKNLPTEPGETFIFKELSE